MSHESAQRSRQTGAVACRSNGFGRQDMPRRRLAEAESAGDIRYQNGRRSLRTIKGIAEADR